MANSKTTYQDQLSPGDTVIFKLSNCGNTEEFSGVVLEIQRQPYLFDDREDVFIRVQSSKLRVGVMLNAEQVIRRLPATGEGQQ